MTAASPAGSDATGDAPVRPWWSLSAFSVVVIGAFSLQPFAAFLTANQTQIDAWYRLVLYGVLVAGFGLAVLVGLRRIRPGLATDRVALAIAVSITSFFNFSTLMGINPPADQVAPQAAVWGVLTVAVALLAYRIAEFDPVRWGIGVFALVYLAVPVISYASYRVTVDDLNPGELASEDVPDVRGDPPNVYWFVLDEYARNDQLESLIGYDNSEFYEELESLGFTVSETSTANYPRTHLSLSSTLQMDYVAEPGNDVDNEFVEFAPLIRGDNETIRRFRAHGYDYVYSDHPSVQWSSCTEDLADVCLPAVSPPWSIDELDQELLELTPLRSFRLFSTPYTEPMQVLEELDERAGEVDEPFFLFAHVGSPHWPYRFGEDCSPRDAPRDAFQLAPADRAAAYVNEVECLNVLMIDAAERIVEADPGAIVLIQSDHGSTFLTNWARPLEEWTPEALGERYAVLNAMRLPPGCDDEAVEGMTLVNTFRLVFSCIEDRQPDLLPTRRFLSPWDDIAEVEEIPEERFEHAGQ
jgi:hypothetical protein